MVKPKLNVSKEFLGEVEKATQSYCKQLVRIRIKDCDSKFNIQHKKLQKSREDLHNLNFDIVESVKKRVHDLNKDLYEECLSIKNKKSDDLLLPSVTHNQDYKKLVVTIPENLHLSDIERKVLSKGLSFIPTSAKNNRNKTNVDLQRFYRHVKLHAYFNDPDKPISNNSDVTKEYSVFNKYKKAASSWTPTDVHPSISRFILRCNEDISRPIRWFVIL